MFAFADGRELTVTEVHATDKTQDVAIIKVEDESLVPLPLGDPGTLRQGQPIFCSRKSSRLEHSVVTGVVSGFRDQDVGPAMIQLAIPIERGNSGGPLLDMQGNVHGLLTLKSLVTDNLGYAVRVNALRDLMKDPHPIPMHRWLTIGTLNPRLWEPQGVRRQLATSRWSDHGGWSSKWIRWTGDVSVQTNASRGSV